MHWFTIDTHHLLWVFLKIVKLPLLTIRNILAIESNKFIARICHTFMSPDRVMISRVLIIVIIE